VGLRIGELLPCGAIEAAHHESVAAGSVKRFCAAAQREIGVMSREELEQEALALFAGIGLAEQTAQ
jgi:hypothetical protein